jgi:CheY-like chemotaxis protein
VASDSQHNRRAKFLVVEDNSEMRRVLRQLLSDLGEICECADGSLAFSAYTAQRPDWVLMDIRLGQANGIQLTSEITAAYPEARVVMVTAYEEEELREAARRAGACGYVVKDNLNAIRGILTSQETLACVLNHRS